MAPTVTARIPLAAGAGGALSTGAMNDVSQPVFPPRRRFSLMAVLVSLIGAALLMAALLTAFAYLGATLKFASRAAALAETRRTAAMLFVALPGYALTFGLAAVLVLDRWLGRRGALAYALAGAVAGVVGVGVQAVLLPVPAGSGIGIFLAAAAVSAAVLLTARLFLALIRLFRRG